MFIDVRYREDSKRHWRGMLIKRDNESIDAATTCHPWRGLNWIVLHISINMSTLRVWERCDVCQRRREMFIDVRHHKDSERHRRGMFMKRDVDQHAAQQHATPDGVGGCSMPRFYKHVNPTGLESASHSPMSQV